MKKKVKSTNRLPLLVTVLFVLTAVLAGLLLYRIKERKATLKNAQQVTLVAQLFDFSKQTFQFEQQQLVEPISMNRTVDASGTRAAAVIVNNSEGSGTFYYIVGAMLKDGKEIYSEPQFLGDRVTIKSVVVDSPGQYDNGEITVNYLTTEAGAPLAAEPTTGVTKKYAFQDDGNLMEVLN